MQRSKTEIGSFFIHFLSWYTVVIALLWIFLTEIMFVSDFAYVTGFEYSEYLLINRVFAEFYIITKKLIGFMLLGIGLLILFIYHKAYRKGEKWSWYAVLIAGSISWGTFIGYKILIGYIGVSMITFVVGAALTIIGLVIPAKEILSKK